MGHCILKNPNLSTACYSNMGQNMGQIVWYQITLNYSELLDIKTKEKVLKSYDFRTFMVAEAGLEPTTSGL